MRKSQKRQIEHTLALLDRAHGAVKKALEIKNSDTALELLEQCQDSAIQIGGMIEEALGEDFITVGFLEDYCELLYQTYELIRQEQPVNVNKTCKSLRKELIRIENSVKNDIQVRIVAVFLPYKASMWDSLESVWMAADKDPDCDAYVVPIPYFDKNPDGSFRQMHYEGNEYPGYVPITSWETYDIEAEHPDIIFIHNPYDEFNYVTSVHPAYYSKTLKNYTDRLVYIPYFILNEMDPNDREAVDNAEHFCTVPAVVYADKVIVQSKDWRQIYIDVMTRNMGDDTRQIWEQKISDLGSPKMDKIHATKKADLDIPEDWLKIIEKPDGSWKKIIFYNTSVSALLRHEEKILKKIEYVLRIFKGKRDEAVLLWRPHPLIKATIESMRPQLWIAYEKMVQTYRAEGWGIYDDTADVNRAVALSDAYYGDHSSLVQMYCETGKPVMLQDVEQSEDRETVFHNKRTEFWSGAVVADRFWYVSARSDFMCMNVENGRTAYVDLHGNWLEETDMVSEGMVVYHSSLYWVDTYKNYVHEFNSTSGEYHRYPMTEAAGYDIHSEYIIGLHRYENELWIFFRNISYIIKFNLDQKKYRLYSGLCEKQINADTEEETFHVCSVQVNSDVYLFQKSGTALKINLAAFAWESVALPNELKDIVRAVWRQERFFLLSAGGAVYVWNRETGNVDKILEACTNGEMPYSAIAVTEHKVFLLPRQQQKIVTIDFAHGNALKQEEGPEDLQYIDSPYGKYGQYAEDASYIWFDNRCSNYVLRINKKTESFEWIKPQLPALQETWDYCRGKKKDFVLHEWDEGLEYLFGIESQGGHSADSDSNVGRSIWEEEMA